MNVRRHRLYKLPRVESPVLWPLLRPTSAHRYPRRSFPDWSGESRVLFRRVSLVGHVEQSNGHLVGRTNIMVGFVAFCPRSVQLSARSLGWRSAVVKG